MIVDEICLTYICMYIFVLITETLGQINVITRGVFIKLKTHVQTEPLNRGKQNNINAVAKHN